jgi:hypothetical protein
MYNANIMIAKGTNLPLIKVIPMSTSSPLNNDQE